MKKILFFAFSVAIFAMSSCGNKQVVIDAEDHDTTEVSTTMDPDIAASEANQLAVQFSEKLNQHNRQAVLDIARQAETNIMQFLLQGDTVAAKSYAQQFKKFFSDNSEKLKAYAKGTPVETLGRLARTANISELTDEADEIIKTDSIYSAMAKEYEKKIDASKQKVAGRVDAATTAVKKTVATAKDSVTKVVKEEVTTKASATVDKINNEANQAKSKLNAKAEEIKKALQD